VELMLYYMQNFLKRFFCIITHNTVQELN